VQGPADVAPTSEAETEREDEGEATNRDPRPRPEGRDLAVDGRGPHRCWAAGGLLDDLADVSDFTERVLLCHRTNAHPLDASPGSRFIAGK